MKTKNQNSIMLIMVKVCLFTVVGALASTEVALAKDKTPSRILRKRADLGHIDAPQIDLPNGKKFDFGYVANAMIYSVIYENQHFAVDYQGADSTNNGVNITSTEFQKVQAAQAVLGKGLFDGMTTEQACLINTPQLRIKGQIYSFELLGGGGLHVGFNSGGGFGSPGVDFNVNISKLYVGFTAYSGLSGTIYGVGNGDATATDLSFAASYMGIGLSFFYNSSLYKTTRSAFVKALDGLVTTTSDKKSATYDPWYTRVIADSDTYIDIIGGINTGMKVGDRFDIYNEDRRWEGYPCASTYIGGLKRSTVPLVTIEITEVGDKMSRGRPVQGTRQDFDSIEPAAKVIINQLVAN